MAEQKSEPLLREVVGQMQETLDRLLETLPSTELPKVAVPMHEKPGAQSSEFLMALAVLVVVGLLLYLGVIPAEEWERVLWPVLLFIMGRLGIKIVSAVLNGRTNGPRE